MAHIFESNRLAWIIIAVAASTAFVIMAKLFSEPSTGEFKKPWIFLTALIADVIIFWALAKIFALPGQEVATNYALIKTGTVVLILLGGYLLFGQKLGLNSWLGIGAAILALTLLS